MPETQLPPPYNPPEEHPPAKKSPWNIKIVVVLVGILCFAIGFATSNAISTNDAQTTLYNNPNYIEFRIAWDELTTLEQHRVCMNVERHGMDEVHDVIVANGGADISKQEAELFFDEVC